MAYCVSETLAKEKSIIRTALVILAVIFAVGPPVPRAARAETPDPPQRFKPEDCPGDPCLRAWFGEYRDGLVGEYRFWQGLEPALFADEMSANRALGSAITRGMYRHNHWSFYRGNEIPGVRDVELNALVQYCRTAIIDLKFLLVARSDGRTAKSDDVEDYLTTARLCENAFQFAPASSPLR